MDNPFNEYLLVAQSEVGRDLSAGSWRSLRPFGWAAIVAGVLWIGGLGSLFAVGFGLIGIVGRHRVAARTYPPPGLRLCQVGVALGLVGLGATAWLLLVG